MSAANIPIHFYYDVISPYSWFAFEVLCRWRQKLPKIDLHLRPFFLGAIMKQSENKPPMMVPNKGKYMFTDLQRLAEYYHVPMRQLKDPAQAILVEGSLGAQRFLLSVDVFDSKLLESASRLLWMRRYNQDRSINGPEDLGQILDQLQLATNDAKRILEDAQSSEIKDKLKRNTQEALDHGAFGAPWTEILLPADGQRHCFWGADRFDLMAHLMGEPSPGPLVEYAAAVAKL